MNVIYIHRDVSQSMTYTLCLKLFCSLFYSLLHWQKSQLDCPNFFRENCTRMMVYRVWFCMCILLYREDTIVTTSAWRYQGTVCIRKEDLMSNRITFNSQIIIRRKLKIHYKYELPSLWRWRWHQFSEPHTLNFIRLDLDKG